MTTTKRLQICVILIIAALFISAAPACAATSISDAVVSLNPNGPAYDGSKKGPSIISVKVGNAALIEGTDYTVTYSNSNIQPGRYTATLKGKGNYTGQKQIQYTIYYNIAYENFSFPGYSPQYLGDCYLKLNKTLQYHADIKQMLSIMTINANGKVLKAGTDYDISATTSANPYFNGRCFLVRFRSPYRANTTVSDPKWYINFKAAPRNADEVEIKKGYDHTFTGMPLDNYSPTVYLDGQYSRLVKDTDFEVEFANNVNVGTARCRISGLDHFYGRLLNGTSAWFDIFDILPRNMSLLDISLGSYDSTYTGKQVKPPVEVKMDVGKYVPKEGRDYKLIYENNVEPGKGRVRVRGIGNLTGERTLDFDIVRSSVTLPKSAKMLTESSDRLPGQKDNTLKLAASVNPVSSRITWKSSDTAVATVDKNGTVTGKKPGSVTITATNAASGASASCKVQVLSRKEYKLQAGAQYTFKSRLDKAYSMDVMYQDYEKNTNVSLYPTQKRAAQRLTAEKKVVNGRTCWMLTRTNRTVGKRAVTENKTKNVIFTTKKDTNWQLFRVYRFNDGSVQFINRATNNAIRVAGGKAGQRVNVESAKAGLSADQRWYGTVG